MKTCKYGCGKMKSGGKVAAVKKMAKGGYAPAQTGGDNTKMGIYGIPNAGRTDSLGFKKGGINKRAKGGNVIDKGDHSSMGKTSTFTPTPPVTPASGMAKKGGITKAKFGESVKVQPGKIGKVTAPDRGYKSIGEREPDRLKFPKFKKGGFPDLNKDGKVTKADVLVGRGVIPKAKKGGSTDKKWIQKAINPAHKGYCTPMTKPTCTPKRKALAMTLKKIAKNR